MNTTSAPLRPSSSSDQVDTVETLKADISKLTETVKTLASEQLGTVAGTVQDKAASTVTDVELAIRKTRRRQPSSPLVSDFSSA